MYNHDKTGCLGILGLKFQKREIKSRFNVVVLSSSSSTIVQQIPEVDLSVFIDKS